MFEIDQPRQTSRRDALRLGAGAAATALAACRGQAVEVTGLRQDGIPTRQLGAITGNDPAAMRQWAQWLGRPQDHDLLYFNQDSWEQLDQSIDYIAGVGREVLAQGRRVQWSVPVGGPGGYDSVTAGQRDDLYRRVAGAILAAYPKGNGRIYVRLPWEFNLPSQSLAARDAGGRWAARLYVAAWRRIAGVFRQVSHRFYFDWCPNIGEGGINPEQCYPGDDVVDVVSLDLYYQGRYDDQNMRDGGRSIFGYRLSQPFGLAWLSSFGARHGKLIGLSEWGVDDDRAVVFAQLLAAWIGAQGSRLSHHNYWNRSDGGINAKLTDGHLPRVARAYRAAFGR
ncbi:hypothetical protein [Sphingomonas phyllosphaerae]|uniref:hypothetical protein n=1 Tax=Sphingomonas phyllosphaerae TaxID=257003 RepID=UPI0024135409|nr:hypothetical protein [Sphingomonas phyllosphaerae]